jgi:hypothetical protein
VQLPKIPYVPAELIPQFLQTLQVASKFFSKCSSDAYTSDDWLMQNARASSGSINPSDNNNINHNTTTDAYSGDLHRSLMNQMDLVTTAAGQACTAAAATEAEEQETSMKRGVHRWMEDVKLFARQNQSRGDMRESAAKNAHKDDIKERGPCVCMRSFYMFGKCNRIMMAWQTVSWPFSCQAYCSRNPKTAASIWNWTLNCQNGIKCCGKGTYMEASRLC